MKFYTANVFLYINTATRVVERVLILCDDNPTVTNHKYAYAVLAKYTGRTMALAQEAARTALESSPYYRWAHDLLAN